MIEPIFRFSRKLVGISNILRYIRGRKLREFDLAAGTESVRLDLRDLPSGVYTLMIGNTTKKLIVE